MYVLLKVCNRTYSILLNDIVIKYLTTRSIYLSIFNKKVQRRLDLLLLIDYLKKDNIGMSLVPGFTFKVLQDEFDKCTPKASMSGDLD